MGGWHARYAVRAGAKVVAVVDRDAAQAERLAGVFGAIAASPDDGWLRATFPDIVHVCTPPGTHRALAGAALDAGAHVVVEKPVTMSASEACDLREQARAQGRFVVPVHQFPFQRGFREVRRRLPELGALRSVDFVTFTAGADRAGGSARRNVALEILPHSVSLFRALGFEVPAEHFVTGRFTNDALEVSAVVGPTRLSARIDLCARPTCNELRITGDCGTALVDLFHGFAVVDRAGTSRIDKAVRPFRVAGATLLSAGENLARRALLREPAYPGLRELLEDVYDRARTGSPAPIDGEEFVQTAALSERLAGPPSASG